MFQVEENAAKVKELERLLPDQDSGPRPGDSSKMEAALKVTEELLNYLQETTEELKGWYTHTTDAQKDTQTDTQAVTH